ncbi:hypothetical protein K1T71_001368 [Dendrolimus kikuchii]|uniref:Uncharacterized protein n=1 Tax=Dendrolimus kikuchii TaxID=765133 RepID=A0ACC1DHN2_9NEOP|nr:hypothetical protein K1T71_001368 [Dendrolimus kikuchii]
MRWILSLFSLAFAFTNVICASTGYSACRSNDSQCLKEQTTAMYKLILPGIKELNIPSSDPMYLKRIEGKFDQMKYELTDSTMTGFLDCKVESSDITSDQKAVWKLSCPNLRISGQYSMNGTIIGVPIFGNGAYFIDTHDYFVTVTTEVKTTKGDDGQFHISYKNFKADADLRGGFDYDAKNLFGGNKQLADSAKTIIKQNWQITAKLMATPIVDSSVRNVLKSVNTYLKSVPAEEVIIF